MTERPQPVELSAEWVRAYADRFISRWDCYPRQLADGSYVAVKQPLTLATIEGHLLGRQTIGAYCLDTANRAKWLCFDADVDEDFWNLQDLAIELNTQDIPAYLEPSRRGGHLWLFFALTPAGDVRRLGRQLLSEWGLADDVELYPKQDELRTGPGSLVRLPLGVHQKSGRRYPFVTLDDQPLAPTIREQIQLLAHPDQVPQEFIDQALARAPAAKPVFPTPRFKEGRQAEGETVSERIKSAVSVREFVSQYVDLNRSNKGLCPFHDDHVESFSVNEAGNYWNCFADCGGGSIIHFWQKWRQLNGQDADFTATITELARMLL